MVGIPSLSMVSLFTTTGAHHDVKPCMVEILGLHVVNFRVSSGVHSPILRLPWLFLPLTNVSMPPH